LPDNVDWLAAIEGDGQTCLFPCIKAAVENIGIAVCGSRKARGIPARARARPAMKYEYFIARARRTFRVQPA